MAATAVWPRAAAQIVVMIRPMEVAPRMMAKGAPSSAWLRVLPWLFGVVLSAGLPTASAFFMAGDHSRDNRLRPTLALMTAAGAAIGAVAWLACSEPFQALFFKQMPIRLVAIMAVIVITQLCTVTAKGCCQGGGDIAGANLVIVVEELWFLFCYPVVL